MASGMYGTILLPPRGIGQRRSATPSIVAVPYGMGLVSSLMSTLYDYAGCSNAINSSQPAADCSWFSINFIGVEPKIYDPRPGYIFFLSFFLTIVP